MSRSRRFSVRKSVVRSTSRSARLRREFHLGMDWLESRTLLSAVASVPTFIVNSNGDQPLANPVAGGNAETSLGTITLRSAIEQANLDGSGTINFSGPMTIDVGSQLDPITASNVSIVGPSFDSIQIVNAGGEIDGLILQGNGGDLIQNLSLSGFNQNVPYANYVSAGIEINSNNNQIANDILSGNSDGILINGSNSNTLKGCYIGTNSLGSTSDPNTQFGIELLNGNYNSIGGSSESGFNLISGNNSVGVVLSNSDDNFIAGNIIGTDISGSSALPNNAGGIQVDGGSYNTIGGTTNESINLISGNGSIQSGGQNNGIFINGSSNNLIQNNLVGTDITGSFSIPNIGGGISLSNSSSSNTIGGVSSFSKNLISGNSSDGIDILAQGSNNNVVEGNYVGVNSSGTSALPNSGNGISVSSFSNYNTIGGTSVGAGNVVSGNASYGLYINSGASYNLAEGNFVGTNSAGTSAIPNGQDGVIINGTASSNTIGGTTPGSGNVISGNTQSGLVISDGGTNSNLIEGNYIGTNENGVNSIPNQNNGIVIENDIFGGPTMNTIGGTSSGSANIISGNSGYGVQLNGVGTIQNQVLGNMIGTNPTGTSALPNQLAGIDINGGATTNTIGGSSAGSGNLISGNLGDGIDISDSGTTQNAVLGNMIGTDISGTTAIPNQGNGIYITGGASQTTIGGTVSGARNLISGNVQQGIYIYGASTSQILIQGNYVGTDAAGTSSIPNQGQGIAVYDGPTSITIGGTSSQAMNLISGNSLSGIDIAGPDVSNVSVLGDFIGVNAAGTSALGNGKFGIILLGGASNNSIGGSVSGSMNVISGNTYEGVALQDTGTNDNIISGNMIGTDVTGSVSIPNEAGVGIYNGPSQNTIGGTTLGSLNVISGNTDTGVVIYGSGTSQNLVQGNMIGVDISGTKALGNGYDGVDIEASASNNTIGGSVQGSMNVISGNLNDGVEIQNSGTVSNLVLGNMIGVNVTGTASIANSLNGVEIHGAASSNTIGGSTAASQNIISGNLNFGVSIYGLGTSNNVLMGNLIGVGAGGSTAIPNSLSGLSISQGATFNTIGGTTTGAGNVISGNSQAGIIITNKGTMRNLVQGNWIGTSSSGTLAIANGTDGIDISSGALLNTIGGTSSSSGNVISGNTENGIELIGYGTTGNVVQGNSIGVTQAGQSLGNGGDGVLFTVGATHNTIGGTTSGSGNTISYNGAYGVQVGLNASDGSYSDAILENSIYANKLLGISLGGSTSTSPNRGLAAPVLSSATESSTTLTINGSLTSTPNSTFQIEFFATDAAMIEAFGAAQGQIFIGVATVTTNGSGAANFSILLQVPANQYNGDSITATTTDRYSDTSQFSNAVVVTAG